MLQNREIYKAIDNIVTEQEKRASSSVTGVVMDDSGEARLNQGRQ
jgi:hypothetical protein